MIHSFSCKNFYSFSDLATVSFVVNDKAPLNNSYFRVSSGNRLSKVEIVVGPNASGKTNLLKVLPFLKWLIVHSFKIAPEDILPVKPFLFGESKNNLTELSSDFEIAGNIFTYKITLTDKRIFTEELKVKNKTKEKLTSKKLFSREWDEKEKKYILEDNGFHLPKDIPLRSNASVISTAIRLTHKESQDIADFWQKVKANVIEVGWVGDRPERHSGRQLFAALDFFGDSKNDYLKKEAEKLLSRFDLGLESFDIKRERKENETTINAKVAHLFGGQTEYLPVKYESSGTKQLLVLLQNILSVLDKGGVAVLDEFDANLHPEMVRVLFELFLQPETNPNNAQILFSTYSYLILSKLDKYQIVFVEKNEKGQSDTWRLSEMVGVRADDNYFTKYIAGAYGAVPKI